MHILLQQFLIVLIKGYQWCISPFLPRCCRYWPTCSAYAVEAVRIHGAGKGFVLACKRILRCNPWSAGGIDPVPERLGPDTLH